MICARKTSCRKVLLKILSRRMSVTLFKARREWPGIWAQDALLTRFGVAPDEVMARLEAISDPETLRWLGGEAWQAKSLEDFITLLPDDKPD